MASDPNPSQRPWVLEDDGQTFLLSDDGYTTLMAHGWLCRIDGRRFRLSTDAELARDSGSAGVSHPSPIAVRAVLRAALATGPQQTVRVRPLVWEDVLDVRPSDEEEPAVIGWNAKSPVGTYSVSEDFFDQKPWQLCRGHFVVGNFRQPDEAKAAAASDFEAKIRGALES